MEPAENLNKKTNQEVIKIDTEKMNEKLTKKEEKLKKRQERAASPPADGEPPAPEPAGEAT